MALVAITTLGSVRRWALAKKGLQFRTDLFRPDRLQTHHFDTAGGLLSSVLSYLERYMAQQQSAVDPSQLRLEQYRALLQVSEAIAANRHLPDLIRDLSVRLQEAVQFDYISLILHDPQRDVLRLQILETPIETTITTGFEMAVDESPAGEAFRTQEPFIAANVEGETRYPVLLQLMRDHNIKSYCSLPLTTSV